MDSINWQAIARVQELLGGLKEENFVLSLNSLMDLDIASHSELLEAFVESFFFVIRLRPRSMKLFFNILRSLLKSKGGNAVKEKFICELLRYLEVPDSNNGVSLDQGVKIMFQRIFDFVKPASSSDELSSNQEFCDLLCELKDDVWDQLMRFISFEQYSEHDLLPILINDDAEQFCIFTSTAGFDWNMVIDDPLLSFWHFPPNNILNLCALFGSVNCAKHCFLVGAVSADASFAQYSCAGGNHELVRLCEQMEVSIKDGVSWAARWWHMQLFEWLIETQQFREEKDLVSAIGQAALTDNFMALYRDSELTMRSASQVVRSAASSGACTCMRFCLTQENVVLSDALCAALLNYQLKAAQLLINDGGCSVNALVVSFFFIGEFLSYITLCLMGSKKPSSFWSDKRELI